MSPLAPAALAAALAEVVRHHRVLRARFVERDGEPRQDIAAAPSSGAPGFLPLVDLTALAAELQSLYISTPVKLTRLTS